MSPIQMRQMNEVMLDRWLLQNLDQAETAWENEEPFLVDDMPREQLSQEALDLLR